MVCEGRKAFFVIDKDGSFKGQGSILPDAAFEYNGNPTAGIGDYRIPIVLQTRLNGSKIEPSEIYQHRGKDSSSIILMFFKYRVHSLRNPTPPNP